jgi:hypothetical protein
MYYHHGWCSLTGCVSWLGASLPASGIIATMPAGYDTDAAMFAQPVELNLPIGSTRTYAHVLVNGPTVSLWSQPPDFPNGRNFQYLWLNGIRFIPANRPGQRTRRRIAPFPPPS